MGEGIRLNKYLSDAGICSRREADRLIEEGRVLIDGVPASMGTKVEPGQTVCCDGQTVGGKDKPVFLVVNKPRGIVCTTSDKDRAENIVEFLNYPQRIYPVGRLDKDSEGLLLMTNQGDIVNKILRGGNNHEKEYAVAVNKPVTEEFLKKMREGVWIENLAVLTKPCRAWQTGSHTFHIVLTQGLNRQIRRMCRALDYHVMKLKRVRIMSIKLGNLERGEYRELTEKEVEELKRMVKDSTDLPMQQAIEESKTARPEQKPMRADSKPAHAGSKPAHSESRTARPEQKPMRAGSKPVHSESRTARPASKMANSDSRPVRPESKTARSDSKPVRPENRNVWAEGQRSGHRLVRVVRRPEDIK